MNSTKKLTEIGVTSPQSSTLPTTTTTTTKTATAPKAPSVNPANITQSYYTPVNLSNYDGDRRTYTQSEAVRAAGQALADHEANKPGEYQSQYGEQIQGMIDSIMNRGKFTYDYSADPLYQQYAQQYQRGGQLAMKDAMAESAALTGGYGNSYAQQVGQQTYQRYMENLNAVIPQLRQAAYEMYQDEGDTMRANLGMLQGADETDYGRYRDTVGDYQNTLNYLYGKYMDMSDQEYQRYMNDMAAWENDRDYWHMRALELAQQAAENAGGGGGGGTKSAKKAVRKSVYSIGDTLAQAAAEAAALAQEKKTAAGGGTRTRMTR
ncbi:MAG: hypothetical protein J6K73_04950 [Clostridia bacterium]|nr:hypothetical protein [Clostridia bacterium]MBP3649110.1 hypothetical protein [Clostridia bacterium]